MDKDTIRQMSKLVELCMDGEPPSKESPWLAELLRTLREAENDNA